MRTIYTLGFLFLAMIGLKAQMVPQGIHYQAVLRDHSGNTLGDREITVKVTILDAVNDFTYYEEAHEVQVAPEGTFGVVIGQGRRLDGSFRAIPWSIGKLWVDIQYDLDGSGRYQSNGAMQLLSVPFAFHAQTAGSFASGLDDEEEEADLRADTEPVEKYWRTNGNQLLPTNILYFDPDSVIANQDIIPQFLGTTTMKPLLIRTNDTLRAFILPGGDLYILKDQYNLGNLDVRGSGRFLGDLIVKGMVDATTGAFFNLQVWNNLIVGNNANIQNNLDVDGSANIDGNLGVYGITRLFNTTQSTTKDNGALVVEGGAGIEKNLNVGGNTTLGGDLQVGGKLTITDATESTATNNGALIVAGGVGIGKRLNVGGITRVWNTTESTATNNGAFTVDGGVGIGRNLRVAGDVFAPRFLDANDNSFLLDPHLLSRMNNLNVANDLNVANTALVSNYAGVGGLYNNVSLTVRSPSSRDYAFYAEVLGTSNLFSMNKDGQLYLRSTKAGPSNNTGNYAMFMDAQNQGLVIRLNDKSWPDSGNKYINFWGSTNVSRGRIEGQTKSELYGSFDYIWTSAMGLADEAFVLAEGIACGVQVDLGEVAVMAAEGIAVYAKWAEWTINADLNCGISYSSGSGDYAEWLEKADPADRFGFGEIVSVNGGKISHNTGLGGKMMVVSMSPIVLGNMPPEGQEARFEKIAFMGQVPVKVKGPVSVGDYIIPSGANDGFGIAVPKGGLKLDQYAQIVGVAWAVNPISGDFSMVNTAVGLNTQDLAVELQRQRQELDAVKSQFNELLDYLKAKDPALQVQPMALSEDTDQAPAITPQSTSARQTEGMELSYDKGAEAAVQHAFKPDQGDRVLERILREKPELILQARDYVRGKYAEAGVTWGRDSELDRIFNDEAYLFEKLRSRTR